MRSELIAGNMVNDQSVSATGAVLRATFQPFDIVPGWSASACAVDAGPDDLDVALAADRRQLTDQLLRTLCDAQLRSSIRLAAPAVFDEFQRWQLDGAPPSRRLLRTLVSYLCRAGARATPFGTFAGCGRLRLGPASRLTLTQPHGRQRRSILDFGLQESIVNSLVVSDPGLRTELAYQANSTIYQVAGRLRYTVATFSADGQRRHHHLASTVCTRALELALTLISGGLAVLELANEITSELRNEGFPVTAEDVTVFVDELIDSQLLVPRIGPLVTRHPDAATTAASLPNTPNCQSARDTLAEFDSLVRTVDEAPAEELPDRLDALESALSRAGQNFKRSQLVHVDTILDTTELTLARPVADNLANIVNLVAGLGPRHTHELALFRNRFRARYESSQVPLLIALDAESGIGYGSSEPATAPLSPLLSSVVFPQFKPPQAFRAQDGARLALLTTALLEGRSEISLNDHDVESLRDDEARIPETFHVLGTLCAKNAAAVDAGDYRFLLRDVDGPGGASLIGRFAASDPALLDLVQNQVAVEESLHPDRIYAEIVHLPDGRMGNVLARPHLRRHEIVFLGASGLPPAQQIALTDLTVTLIGERIVLRSESLHSEVVPRLTTAHNFTDGSLPVYRFLCDLQYQDADARAGWDWGPLKTAPFLPRVRLRNIVLARARWLIEPAEGAALRQDSRDGRRWLAVQDLRRRRRLPRWVVLSEHDHELVLDLENVLCVDVLIGRFRHDSPCTLLELFPTPEDLCLRDAKGHRFVHELLITGQSTHAAPTAKQPNTSGPPPAPQPAPRSPPPRGTSIPPPQRRFPPSSPWLYLRLYGGEALADEIITGPLTDFNADPATRRAVDLWFFIRYRDDQPHLRIRWHTSNGGWPGDVTRRLEEFTRAALGEELIYRADVSTYEREVERYGGPSGIGLAEQIFSIDSDAVASILQLEEGEGLARLRMHAAVLGTDRLLDDLGLPLKERLTWARTTSTALQAEIGGGPELTQSLARSFRARRAELTALLGSDGSDPLGAVLGDRSARLSPLVATLRAQADSGMLTSTLPELAGSYVHMYLNRLLRSDQRASEMVVAEWLFRVYRARAAQAIW